MKALIKIETDNPALAEQVTKFLINKINGENRQIAVSKARKRFGKYEKKVIFGKIREENKKEMAEEGNAEKNEQAESNPIGVSSDSQKKKAHLAGVSPEVQVKSNKGGRDE